MLKSASPILVYGGAICEASPSGAQSRKGIHLRVDQDCHHLAQVECARQMYDLDRFLFYRSRGVVGRPGFSIGNRTIKRGSQVSFSVSVVESSNLCIIGIILSWFLFDSYRSEILCLL